MKRFTHGAVAHFDVAGPDAKALGAFYADILDWQVTPRGEGYAQIETAEGSPDGAIVEAEATSITLGIAVKDIDDTLGRVQTAGGRIVMPKTDNGWVVKAQIADVFGNVVTLIQM